MILEKYKKNIKNKEIFFAKNVAPDLFKWNELEFLLNLRPFVSDSRLTIISHKAYRWLDTSGWLTDVNTYPAHILDKEIRRHVCYLRDCSRVNEKINNLCSELEKITRMPTDAHIYFSMKEKYTDVSGFSRHNDQNYNLIICSEGTMQIQVWEGEKEHKFELENGDVVFIPKEVDHQINPHSKRISVSFAMSNNSKTMQTRDWIKL